MYFQADGMLNEAEIPKVTKALEVHEQRNSKEADILTKGDANLYDDRMLYTSSNRWLQKKIHHGQSCWEGSHNVHLCLPESM
ncbi:signal peptidase complex catalytic subunit SEC11A isoform X3 [Gossypium hirsutum]|uniref:Signal peptidase complex catalytic subunit SEC11A isoform X2 n=1 Tax=Gossypium hirsutum TaxID=3635 RepID=A0ABM2YK22_GOSHI|nr:signal peptidase complex catalytic subunit SEC11A-like isoform X2 [Gossypium hirsutum]XP_040948099.1 signal peptidase complex catalytic subunit SEC11A-like isoform X3 [Gossypium hirsutum]